MRKILFILVSVFLLTFLTLLLGEETVNVSGDWELTLVTPRGERTSDLTLVQEGEKLKVTMQTFRGTEVSGEGTVKGNEIEWTITMSTPMGERTMTYKGKIEGETMSGEVQMGDSRTAEWKAKRKAK